MKKYYLPLFLVIFSFQSFGQGQLKKYVQKSTVPINSIEADYADDSDLEEISKAIGDARVVMLGEQDHGDGATMQAKTRLVKFLYEKKGFNVLAFEGEFFALNQGWEQLPKDQQQVQTFFQQNLFGVWSFCQQCSELLYSYIPNTYQTDKPLHIAGFDNQLSSKYSMDSLSRCVNQYLRKLDIPFVRDAAYQQQFGPTVHALTYPSKRANLAKDKVALERFDAMADTILSQLSKSNANDFEYKLIKSLKEFAKQLRTDVSHEATVIRDRQMAENLLWLTNVKYPKEKIIVWAANGHIMKNAATALKHKQYAHDWMGGVYTQDSLINEQTYIIGFSSKEGTFRRTHEPKSTAVPKPLKNGFETWIDEKLAYAFIDFKRFRRECPAYSEYFPMKGHGQNNGVGVWSDMFDGIFFIKEMTPCASIK